MNLYPSQIPHTQRLIAALKKYKAAADLSDTGTGKTYCACAAAKALGLQIFVVCPKSVILNWRAKAEEAGVGIKEIINYEKLRLRKEWMRGKKFQWPAMPDALIIFDEAHYLKGTKTLNSKLAVAARASGNRVLLLSATLAVNPLEMRATGFVLGLHRYHDFWQWAKKHGATESFFGGLEFTGGPEHMTKLHQMIIPERGSRLIAKDMAEFPQNLVVPTLIPCEKKSEIETLCNEVLSEFEKTQQTLHNAQKSATSQEEKEKLAKEIANRQTARGLTLTLKLRQALEKYKVPAIVEMTKNAIADGNSVVIFVNFDETLQEVARHLNCTCLLYGKQSTEERQKSIERFQSNQDHIIICNTKTGGAGVSLHDIHGRPRVSIISPDWSAVSFKQVLGRICRHGGKSKAVQKIIFFAGTIEERVYSAITLKIHNLNALNDGDMNPIQTPAATASEREHAPFSPSSLALRSKCPGFINDNSEERAANPAAQRGEIGHKAVEINDLSVIPTDDDALREAAQACLLWKQDRIKEWPGCELIQEARYDMLDQWGYVDCLLVDGTNRRARLMDWKFAHSKYEANSPQFWAYCVGIWDRHPEIDAIHVDIVMPFRDEIDSEIFYRADKEELTNKVRTIIEAAKQANPEAFRQGHYCAWCARNGRGCPATDKAAHEIATRYNSTEPQLAQVHSSQITDPAEMSKALTLAGILEKWCASVRVHGTKMAKDGATIPGFTLTTRKGKRVLANLRVAWDIVKDQFTIDEYLNLAEMPYTALEKAYAEKAPQGQKGKFKEFLEDSLRDAGALQETGETVFLTRSKLDQ